MHEYFCEIGETLSNTTTTPTNRNLQLPASKKREEEESVVALKHKSFPN